MIEPLLIASGIEHSLLYLKNKSSSLK